MNKISLWKPFDSALDGISQGEATAQFEKQIAVFLGIKYAVAVSSGTAALYLALKAFDIKAGNTVAVPDLTAIGTVNAVAMTGAEPKLYDVGENGCLDLDELHTWANAIIPVQFNGRCCPGSWFKHPIIIEDACQALGSYVAGKIPEGNKYLGTLGQCGCFSFSPTKTIYTGQGGLITTNHYWLYKKLVLLRDQGRIDKSDDYVVRSGNFKFTDLQAKLALQQLANIDTILTIKNGIYDSYFRQLAELGDMWPREKNETLWLPDFYTKQRDELHQFLLKKGVQTRKFYTPIHVQKPYETKQDFPNSEKLSAQGLWLPASHGIGVHHVCKLIQEFFA